MERLLFFAALSAAATVAGADVLHDNGTFVNRPGAGFNGADASVIDPNFFGSGNVVSISGSGPYYRGAEDFTVTGDGWTLDRVRVHAWIDRSDYGFPPASPFTGIEMHIMDGPPDNPASSIVATSTTMVETGWTGAYRVTQDNLTASTSPVMYLDASFADLNLPAGTYWINFQVYGGPGAFAVTPYTVGEDGLNAEGNAMVLAGVDFWVPTSYGDPRRGIGYAFTVTGSAAGSCPADFNADGALSLDDFVQFRNAYVAGNMAADFDGNGSLSLNDFVTFRNAYVAGCP